MGTAVQVIQSAVSAEALLKPDRLRLLEMLAEPASAAGLARRLKLPRQTVNYHLKELEREGFVEFVESRPKGNCLERLYRATARSFVISPQVLGTLGLGAATVKDQFSSGYLVSAAARAIRDVSILRQRADRAGKGIATLSAETEIRFTSAQTRKEFTEELLSVTARLAARYHNETAPGGRRFRLLVAAYPVITQDEAIDEAPVRME